MLEPKVSGGAVVFQKIVLSKESDNTRMLVLLEETLAKSKYVVRVTCKEVARQERMHGLRIHIQKIAKVRAAQV